MYKKIPNNKEIEIYKENNFIDSPLVEITDNTGIIIDMQYPKLGMENAINKCLVRKEVLDKLLEAKKYLPNNITFKIWDAYRPLSLQKEIYYKYKDIIIKEFNLENLSEEKRNKIISNYVSYPSDNVNIPPLHSTGGAIDLTIAYIDIKKELDLGVKFDEFSPKTNSDYYEKNKINKTIRDNRRILYNAMTKAGFTNLPSEIWHYDYGNRAWAFYKKDKAIYNGILERDFN